MHTVQRLLVYLRDQSPVRNLNQVSHRVSTLFSLLMNIVTQFLKRHTR